MSHAPISCVPKNTTYRGMGFFVLNMALVHKKQADPDINNAFFVIIYYCLI